MEWFRYIGFFSDFSYVFLNFSFFVEKWGEVLFLYRVVWKFSEIFYEKYFFFSRCLRNGFYYYFGCKVKLLIFRLE